MYCNIKADNGNYELQTPYDPEFVSDLKSLIPFGERVYNRDRKSWTVDRKHGQLVQSLCQKYFGITPKLPALAAASTIVGLLEILYIGRSKVRTDGSKSAFGWMEKGCLAGWNAVIPETALRNFFEPSSGTEQGTPPAGNYFEMLGIKTDATEQEIKTAYRRMVKQWHPDVCKDPDAHEIFIGIQKAYEVLSDPKLKARYRAGLKLEALTPKAFRKQIPTDEEEYRSPLKCGSILCEYTRIGSRYLISKIFNWDDITDDKGHTLVSSWEPNSQEPTLMWL